MSDARDHGNELPLQPEAFRLRVDLRLHELVSHSHNLLHLSVELLHVEDTLAQAAGQAAGVAAGDKVVGTAGEAGGSELAQDWGKDGQIEGRGSDRPVMRRTMSRRVWRGAGGPTRTRAERGLWRRR